MAARVRIDGEEAGAAAGASLFEVAEELGVHVPTSCHKNGKCRECLVEVSAGMQHLLARTEVESHLDGALRLACQARIADTDGEVRLQTLRRGSIRVVDEAFDLGDRPAPDPAVTRDGERVLLDGEEVGRCADAPLGVAVDLGTTTVSLRLVDLESGEVLALSSFENPQRFGGSDVLARVSYDRDHPDGLLRRVLHGYLTRAIEGFGRDPGSIFEVVVAGNPTMRDLFFGLDVQPLGQMPYRSITERELRDGERETTRLEVGGKASRLPIHPRGRVVGLPLIGSHVGADAAAAVLATGMARSGRTQALVDIGTNTEVVVGDERRLVCASCPAGPAFEGGQLTCGMPALEGAIERVVLDERGRAACAVIGAGPPEGLCGSGLVDLLSELLRTGRMNTVGRLADGSLRFPLDEERGVHLSEADAGLLAQAKAANVAGLELVLRSLGVGYGELDRLFLAGGFARHLDLDAARRIGLVPSLPDERIVQVGNASLEGATIALLSSGARRELEELVLGIEHIELETFEDFFEVFAEGIQFKPFGAPEVVP